MSRFNLVMQGTMKTMTLILVMHYLELNIWRAIMIEYGPCYINVIWMLFDGLTKFVSSMLYDCNIDFG